MDLNDDFELGPGKKLLRCGFWMPQSSAGMKMGRGREQPKDGGHKRLQHQGHCCIRVYIHIIIHVNDTGRYNS